MADLNERDAIHVDTDEARAGSTPGVVRYILAISLVLVIAGFLAVYFLH